MRSIQDDHRSQGPLSILKCRDSQSGCVCYVHSLPAGANKLAPVPNSIGAFGDVAVCIRQSLFVAEKLGSLLLRLEINPGVDIRDGQEIVNF